MEILAKVRRNLFIRSTIVGLALIFTVCLAQVSAQEPDMVDDSALAGATLKSFHAAPQDLANGQAHARFGIFGIDSIPNFNLHFFANGVDSSGNPNRIWYTNTVGNPPQIGGTTVISAPLQPVNVELDDANGNLRFVGGQPLISLATPFVAPVLASPVFSNALYTSGDVPTQFTDAVQRAEFFNHPMKPDWHTLLKPQVARALTVHFRQTATCNPGGVTGCTSYFRLNPDGTCCRFILVNFGPFVNGFASVVIADIVENVITTKDISSFLFPLNTLQYFTDRRACCVGGLHTYFFLQNSNPEPRWVVNYSSWVSPDIFLGASDITGLSHEIAETFNDPFVVSDNVHDLTPWWLAPNGDCQNNLETGDVVTGFPNSSFPVTLNGFTYHPQNEALLQWFEFMTPSDALGGAYSYPDTSLLTKVSAPQKINCAP